MFRKGLMMLCLLLFCIHVVPSFAQNVAVASSGQMKLLKSLGDGATLMHATPAAIAGFKELIVRDGRGIDHLFYLSKDGNMVFSGSLLDIRHHKNITQASYKKFVSTEIAKAIKQQQQFFVPYHEHDRHENNKQPLYLFLGTNCPRCLQLWDKGLTILNKKYDVYLSYGGLRSLNAKQSRKAMQGWCLKGSKRRLILTAHSLETSEKDSTCTMGTKAFNNMKAAFGRYVRRIPVAYNASGEVVSLPLPEQYTIKHN